MKFVWLSVFKLEISYQHLLAQRVSADPQNPRRKYRVNRGGTAKPASTMEIPKKHCKNPCRFCWYFYWGIRIIFFAKVNISHSGLIFNFSQCSTIFLEISKNPWEIWSSELIFQKFSFKCQNSLRSRGGPAKTEFFVHKSRESPAIFSSPNLRQSWTLVSECFLRKSTIKKLSKY